MATLKQGRNSSRSGLTRREKVIHNTSVKQHRRFMHASTIRQRKWALSRITRALNLSVGMVGQITPRLPFHTAQILGGWFFASSILKSGVNGVKLWTFLKSKYLKSKNLAIQKNGYSMRALLHWLEPSS